MSLTVYADLPDITLYDVLVALMVYKNVLWNIQTPKMHFKLNQIPTATKADQLQKETGMKVYPLLE